MFSKTRSPRSRAGVAVVAAVLVSVQACGGKHYLNQYDFADRTLSLVYIEPPSPQLLHGYYDIYNRSQTSTIVQTAVYAAGGVAKEVVARRATARLDSATQRVDVSGLLAQRTLERASRYLGTRPVVTQNGADFVLEITMKSFGIDARGSAAAYLYTNAEAVLLDRHTGREIWSSRVHGNERLTPWVAGTRDVPSTVITAGTLSQVSVDDFQHALEQLTTYTSNLITSQLRANLRDARDR